MPDDLERIKGYFYQSWSVMLTGAACGVFFLLYLLPDSTIIRIFPALPSWYYIALGAAIGFYQGLTYRSYRFFKGNIFKYATTYFLFLSEFMTMMFAVSLLSWPFYFVYLFFQYLFKLN